VTVELPAGSRIEADAGIGALRFTGQLGKCQVKMGAGDVELEQVGPLDLRTMTCRRRRGSRSTSGPDRLLAAARVYDDVEPPAGHP